MNSEDGPFFEGDFLDPRSVRIGCVESAFGHFTFQSLDRVERRVFDDFGRDPVEPDRVEGAFEVHGAGEKAGD